MEKVKFSVNAFSKFILHCLKHLSNDCYGALIGNLNDNIYNIIDVIPISHERLYAPQIEISFKLFELTNSDKKNCIIGFYENLTISYINDQKFSSTANFITENIHSKAFKNPLLISMINKESTSDNKDENSVYRTKEEPEIKVYSFKLKIFRYAGQNFECLGEYQITSEQKDKVRKLLSEKIQNDIVDFDDHFMDSSLDWRNDFINK